MAREIRQVDDALVLIPGKACGYTAGEKTAPVVNSADMYVKIYLHEGPTGV